MYETRWLTKPIIELEPKQANRATILHISDLHFTSTTSRKTPHLEAIISHLREHEKEKPDIVVCTGDIVDSSVSDSVSKQRIDEAMRLAKEFLIEEVCHGCDINADHGLFVVPGNHDFRLRGILVRRILKKRFLANFEKYFRSALIPNLRLLLCSFDSNTAQWAGNFATGEVAQQEFTHFQTWLASFQSYPYYHDLVKIALLHHHPMPIAEMESDGIGDPVQYMILRNAGTFMREVVKGKIDLILHGHEHLLGYSRASFPTHGLMHPEMREVAVIAAGSVGRHRSSGLPRSFNFIKIPFDGQITVSQQVLWSGTYEAGTDFKVPETEAEWRRRKAERRGRQVGIKIRGSSMFSEYEIDTAGDAIRNTTYIGLKAHDRNSQIKSFQFEATAAAAKFGKPVAKSLNGRHNIQFATVSPVRSGKEKLEMSFSPPLTGRESESANLELRQNFYNAVSFTIEDRKDALKDSYDSMLPQPENPDTDSAGSIVRGIFESLSVRVQFRHEYEIKSLHVRAVPGRGDVEHEEFGENDEPDESETRYCQRHFSYSEASRIAHLSIDWPLPMYNYQVRWYLPEAERPKFDALTNGAIEDIERAWADLDYKGSPKKKQLSERLGCLRRKIISEFQLKGHRGDPEVALMYFDKKPSTRVLRIAAGSYPENHPIYNLELKKGQGIEGQAFRRRQGIVCVAGSEVWQRYFHHLHAHKDSESFLFVACLTYPINSPNVAGILRVASTENTSDLLKLQDNIKLQQKLSDIVQESYIKLLPILNVKPPIAVYKNGEISRYQVSELPSEAKQPAMLPLSSGVCALMIFDKQVRQS